MDLRGHEGNAATCSSHVRLAAVTSQHATIACDRRQRCSGTRRQRRDMRQSRVRPMVAMLWHEAVAHVTNGSDVAFRHGCARGQQQQRRGVACNARGGGA